MKIGYIVSKYPAVSHTFIQREVLGLRAAGWQIETISIRPAAARDLLTESDRAESRRTRVVVGGGIGPIVAGVFAGLLSPGAFFRGLKAAWGLRRAGLKGQVWPWFYFVEALVVARLCRRAMIDHLHAHFANVAADVALIVGAMGAVNGFSFTMHGPTEFYEVTEHKLAEKARAAKFVICISDFARSQMMGLLGPADWEKLEVVHCGVDPEQFAGSRDPRADAFEILCVARMAAVKGHAILLDAVADLLRRGRMVKVTLAGDGPLRASLETLAEQLGIARHITFLGNVGQDVIHTLYARAHVFVLPSFAEGVPVVLMEAMAARCPVIATRIMGIPELIEDGVSGQLVPPGRADLLAAAIEAVIDDPAATGQMAEAGRTAVARGFNLNRTAGELGHIFENRLGASRTRVTELEPPEPSETLVEARGAA